MFTYVPVLRYRQEERAALKSITFQKSIPLIEIVSEKPDSRMNGDFDRLYQRELNQIRSEKLMVDFPTYIRISSRTLRAVAQFLQRLQADSSQKIDYFNKLKTVPNLIPVISYNPQVTYINKDIVQQAKALRTKFHILAFRLFYKDFSASFADTKNVIQPNDILIFDLDTAPHNNPSFKNIYHEIHQLQQKVSCKTVLLRSSLNQDITNIGLVDDQPIPQADNSLRNDYRNYHFNAFGDYAGIKKDDLTDGGSISPGAIFYSWHNNGYIGYRGRFQSLNEFETHIAPSIINSSYFKNYSQDHRQNCPGCQKILNIYNRNESGRSQGKWKRIAAMHYLYTMEEFL